MTVLGKPEHLLVEQVVKVKPKHTGITQAPRGESLAAAALAGGRRGPHRGERRARRPAPEGGGLVNPDMNSAERLEEARQRVSDMLATAAVLGTEIVPEEISRAALVPIPPVGEFFAALLANSALRSFEGVARILAGLGDDRVIAMFMDQINASTPVRRPRRPRPTAADRARAATAWLNGPAWTIVDPDPNPSSTEGAP
jgi:hypothetical protein